MQHKNSIIKPHLWSICSEIDPSIGRVNVYNRLTKYLNRTYKLNLSNCESTNKLNEYESLRLRYNLCNENFNTNDYPICFDKTREEFECIDKLGEGGFGRVYKVRHKFDKALYALKKIEIKFEDEFYHKLNEVQIWANYSKCQYIVEYKTHWVEYSTPDDNTDPNENNHQTVEKSKKVESRYLHYSDEVEIKDEIKLIKHDLHSMQKFLCIQMELCLMTLRDAITIIRKELNLSAEDYNDLLPKIGQYLMSELSKELISAVDYLHSNQILHRDLKDSNILISNGYNNSFIKLGDFGLSKKQCNYTFARQYDCDIYYLGVVMARMFGLNVNHLLKYRFSDNWSKIVATYKKLNGDPDNETKRMDNYKTQTLSLICGMLDRDSVARKLTCGHILSDCSDNFVTFEEIKSGNEFRSICYEMWSKSTLQDMKPLSSYIVYKKGLQRLEIGRKYHIHSGSEPNQLYFDCINKLSKLCKLSCITSNIVDNVIKENIYKIIIHAFTIAHNFDQTVNYIEEEIEKLFPQSRWKCLFFNHYSHLKIFKFYDEIKYYCVEFNDCSGSEQTEKTSLVIFEMTDHTTDNDISNNEVHTLKCYNMSEIIIDCISQLILYSVNNLTHDTISEFVCLNLHETHPDYDWRCVSLQHSFLYPIISYHTFDNENRMYCAMRCKQYCFVVTNFELIHSTTKNPDVIDNYESNDNTYLSEILYTSEGEKLSKQQYNKISAQNKKALFEIYLSIISVRQHIELFEVKSMKLSGKTCLAIIDYNDCVGYTARNFESCYCLRDNNIHNTTKCVISLNWL